MSLPCRARDTHHPNSRRTRLRRARRHHRHTEQAQLDDVADQTATHPLDIPTSFILITSTHPIMRGPEPA